MPAVEGLDVLADDLLAAAQVGIAHLVVHRPAVHPLHVEDVLGSPLAAQRAEHEVGGRLAPLRQQRLQVMQHGQVAPHALAQHRPGHVREDPRRREAEEVAGVLPHPLAAGALLRQGQVHRGDAVVDQVDCHRAEVPVEEPQLLADVVAHGEDAIAVPRRPHERVLVVLVDGGEEVLELLVAPEGVRQEVVEHCVVALVLLHDRPHRGHFVRVEDRPRPGGARHHRLQRQGHAHVLVREDYHLLLRAVADDHLHRLEARLRQPHVLLELPDLLEGLRGHAELLEQLRLEEVQPVAVGVEDVHEDHFRVHPPAGAGLVDGAAAVDDPHVVRPLDGHEFFVPGGGVDGVQGAVDHVPALAQAEVDGPVRRQQRADQDRPGHLPGVGLRGRKARDHRPDPPHLLDRLMRHVHNDHVPSLGPRGFPGRT